MRRIACLLVSLGLLLAACLAAPPVQAQAPPKKPITYPSVKQPPAVFSHEAHMKPGRVASCKACHPVPFKMKAMGTKFTMADITAGKACGVCHNSKKAFGPNQCAKCHPKK